MTRVGLLGTGIMGGPMAAQLAAISTTAPPSSSSGA
jgi:3-hydroxyisobutyrate dehydrogenase-like beta-hydroxyacid dehydrogenase